VEKKQPNPSQRTDVCPRPLNRRRWASGCSAMEIHGYGLNFAGVEGGSLGADRIHAPQKPAAQSSKRALKRAAVLVPSRPVQPQCQWPCSGSPPLLSFPHAPSILSAVSCPPSARSLPPLGHQLFFHIRTPRHLAPSTWPGWRPKHRTCTTRRSSLDPGRPFNSPTQR